MAKKKVEKSSLQKLAELLGVGKTSKTITDTNKKKKKALEDALK